MSYLYNMRHILVLLSVVSLFSCTKKKGFPFSSNTTSTPTTNQKVLCNLPTVISYSATVGPLLTTKCLPCHTAPNSSGINLDSYQGVKTSTINNTIIDALNGNNSLTLMPPGAPLDSCQIKAITNWVNQGCLNN